MIAPAGSVNFRDVGGLSAGPARVREGVLFRSGNLARLEPAGTAAIGDLGIRSIIDLRDDDEVTHAPSRLAGLELAVHRVPLFLGSVESFFTRDLSLEEMYRALIDDSAASIAEVVRGIAGGSPVLVHCTVGKDRTGVTVALALAAAGVDEDAVVADYARTESLLPAARNRAVVTRLKALHPDAVHLEELATRSPASVMRGMLAYVADRHGSATGYLRDSGLTAAELTELRGRLLGV
ncbi:tyrosine-protein phosphatase [Microbacterium sp. ASV49]|uniref:Tyrosine-protein phosphatase n=1 Tax=Microbacterium candidum TaxID=3041922 RepID=A0ABT7N139_9MICO|nr:tyrosine-protein phosphatase [Microbacterium sp. ASV49]MDL9980427.1 tyrosine-protein phosphatase [Microbacterium sp. ASV49]